MTTAVAAKAIAENNMDNARTTSSLTRANRRARGLSSRGRVRPRRPVLSKVVDVVSNSNDALGTTVGSKSNGKYSPAVLSAFGETLETPQCEATSDFKHQTSNSRTFFTGKPFVEGLGHAFLMRNYRAGLAKWQTADPMGYPDGWNQLAYCNNGVTSAVDLWGALIFGVYDLNNPSKSLSSVQDIAIVNQGAIQGEGACSTQVTGSLNLLTKEITINFLIGITVLESRTIPSASVSVGTEVHYTKHRLTPTDADFDLPVYEAVRAHEEGHANYELNTTAVLLRWAYFALELDWRAGVYSESEVRNKILEIADNYDAGSWAGSGKAANEYTISWFEGSPEWRLLTVNSSSERTLVWEKVE